MLTRLLRAAAIAASLFVAPAVAMADYPEKPIRYLLHVSPGGATDVMARKLAIAMEKTLGVPLVVENKPGGRGATQLADLASAKPDGYTIGAVTSTHIGAFNQTLKQYNVDSFDWIARLVNEPYLIVVNKDSKIKSFKDLVDAANAKPGSVVMAGFVRGSGGHFAWEIMAQSAGLDSKKVRWVPFDSVGDAVTAALGGHAEAAIAYVDLVKTYVDAGSLRVIGIMSEERARQFPDVPTLKEQGFDADTSWQQMRGIIGPKGIPEPIKAKLAAAVEQALKTPELVAYMDESSLIASFQPPAEFTATAARENALTKEWMERLGLTR
ncbi:Bug family tripartite tricarboxylate transporter substrate binding protein [Ancylobacter mangrovi]|uniref:Bug family tripartite tricarboxylate transporter substrate binding protein n=1 Tax=Ancylobacter mangrovi TaxID=2972472 RepID=UPI00216349C5|nr:tripartite tricarboxylate transporter substrate binding protein [Ancylobacter mangrovi]MCS0504700.1 tripartite tricarboxylate transporter substrate binding protein [Ancylobacter mangrovi]